MSIVRDRDEKIFQEKNLSRLG